MARSAFDYDAEFFRRQRKGSRSSAEAIVPLLVEWLRPKSVVDVGCGVGEWPAAFARLGVDDVFGVDGGDVDPSTLSIPRERFLMAPLDRPLPLGRTFDLALCLEVAEHLPEPSAEVLVRSLCALAPVVVFSAAIPGQGGTGHVHEAWPSAWARRFDALGYAWADPIRPRAWTDPRIEFWYAQNAILFHRRERFAKPYPWDAAPPRPEAPLPLVHPGTLERALRHAAPTMRNAWRAFRGAVRRGLRLPPKDR